MKKIIGFMAAFALMSYTVWIGVYDLKIVMPDGSEQVLSTYQGKKMMIVVLPSGHTSNDSSTLAILDTLNLDYRDSVTMIGIPSYEDGFEDDSLSSLMSFYRSYLDSSFIIGAGMSTRKGAIYQSPLFSYLTDASQNGYFDKDVYGTGEVFFINETGNLYAISTPDADLNEDVFQEMINK